MEENQKIQPKFSDVDGSLQTQEHNASIKEAITEEDNEVYLPKLPNNDNGSKVDEIPITLPHTDENERTMYSAEHHDEKTSMNENKSFLQSEEIKQLSSVTSDSLNTLSAPLESAERVANMNKIENTENASQEETAKPKVQVKEKIITLDAVFDDDELDENDNLEDALTEKDERYLKRKYKRLEQEEKRSSLNVFSSSAGMKNSAQTTALHVVELRKEASRLIREAPIKMPVYVQTEKPTLSTFLEKTNKRLQTLKQSSLASNYEVNEIDEPEENSDDSEQVIEIEDVFGTEDDNSNDDSTTPQQKATEEQTYDTNDEVINPPIEADNEEDIDTTRMNDDQTNNRNKDPSNHGEIPLPDLKHLPKKKREKILRKLKKRKEREERKRRKREEKERKEKLKKETEKALKNILNEDIETDSEYEEDEPSEDEDETNKYLEIIDEQDNENLARIFGEGFLKRIREVGEEEQEALKQQEFLEGDDDDSDDDTAVSTPLLDESENASVIARRVESIKRKTASTDALTESLLLDDNAKELLEGMNICGSVFGQEEQRQPTKKSLRSQLSSSIGFLKKENPTRITELSADFSQSQKSFFNFGKEEEKSIEKAKTNEQNKKSKLPQRNESKLESLFKTLSKDNFM